MSAKSTLVQLILNATTAGKSLLTAANAAAQKVLLSLQNVDNTSDADKPVSTAQQTALDLKANLASPALTGTPTTPTAAGGTNTTQIASTAFVTSSVASAVTGLLEFQGNIDCSANPNYPAGSKGDTYYVSVAGKIGGASGVTVAVGDAIVCKADNAGGTEASVGTSWFALEKNLAGALLSANNLSDVASASTARTNLGLGSLATQSGTFSGTSSGTNTGDQNLFSTISVSGQSDVVADATSDTLTLVAGTNISITTVAGTDTITITSTAAGLSGTGSVDNAVLRADGTGGATLQNSAWIIADNATASPNNTVNHASLEATGGTTNVSVSIKPKGTGSFSLAVPDGTTTGGNVRGAYSIDLQRVRNAANQVASGDHAVLLGGYNNRIANGYNWGTIVNGNLNTVTGASAVIVAASSCTASGVFAAIVSGNSNTASAEGTFIGCGAYNTSSGTYSAVVTGEQNVASGICAFIGSGLRNQATAYGSHITGGLEAKADRYGMSAYAAGQFAAAGDAQSVGMQARNRTTSAVATELFLDGSSTRLTIPSGKVLSALVRVLGIKSDGSEAIKFLRDVTIKNVGGTTSLEAATVTVGTDINVSGATLDLSADNTNDTLKIAVTPPAGTWRWHAIVECANEIGYGT